MSKFILMLIVLILTSCSLTKSNKSDFNNGKETVLKLESSSENPRNGEGDFIELKNGNILFVYTHYYGSSNADWASAYVASRVSKDGGQTWSKKSEMVFSQEGSANDMSISLFRLSDGSIGLINCRIGGPKSCTPYMRTSIDEGKTWSRPWKCIPNRDGYFQVNNDRVVVMDNGRVLMPVVEHEVNKGDWGAFEVNKGIIWNYYSDDNGKTWKVGDQVEYPRGLGDSIMLQEPGLISLKDGDVLMYMRTTSHSQFLSLSKNQGVSWSEATPSKIKSPNSPALIKRIPSTGDLLMVWNNNGDNHNRTPFTIATSSDEGETWTNVKSLRDDPEKSYSYPAIYFTSDDHVLVAYYVDGLTSLNIDRISLDWLYK